MTETEKGLQNYLVKAFEMLKEHRNQSYRIWFTVATISAELPENHEFRSRLEAEKETGRLAKLFSLPEPEVYDELIRQVKAL